VGGTRSIGILPSRMMEIAVERSRLRKLNVAFENAFFHRAFDLAFPFCL
jgi:hypothetical protein